MSEEDTTLTAKRKRFMIILLCVGIINIIAFTTWYRSGDDIAGPDHTVDSLSECNCQNTTIYINTCDPNEKPLPDAPTPSPVPLPSCTPCPAIEDKEGAVPVPTPSVTCEPQVCSPDIIPCGSDEERKRKEETGETWVKCRHTANLGSFCEYERLCLEGRSIVFLDDSPEHNPGDGFANTGGLSDGFVHRTRGEIDAELPYRSFFSGRYERTSWTKNAVWQDDWSIAMAFDAENSYNIFHFNTKMLAGFTAKVQMMEDTMKLDEVNPALLNLSAGSPGFFFKHVHLAFTNPTDYQKRISEIAMGPPEYVNYDWGMGDAEKRVCFRKAVIPGCNLGMFEGNRDADRFRDITYKSLNIVPNPSVVTFIKRSKSRIATNMDDIVKTMEDQLDIPIEVVNWDHGDFETQVKQMAKTTVFVLLHGSEMNNCIFMNMPGAVVEVDAPRFAYQLCWRIALANGHFYFHLNAHHKDTVYPDGDRWREASYGGCMRDPQCEIESKSRDLAIPKEEFMRTMKRALSLVAGKYYEDL